MRCVILLALLLAAAPATAQAPVTHRLPAGGFTLRAPPDWEATPVAAGDSSLVLHGPNRHPAGAAECTATHRAEPELRALTQQQIDTAAATTPITEAQARQSLGDEGTDAVILNRRATRLAGLPAQAFGYEAMVVLVEGVRLGARGEVVMVRRPQGIITLNCSTLGRDVAGARQAFEAWRPTMTGIMGSLAFD